MDTCASCSASVVVVAELADEARTTFCSAVYSGVDLRPSIGVRCDRCERVLCYSCAFGESWEPERIYACNCGGLYTMRD